MHHVPLVKWQCRCHGRNSRARALTCRRPERFARLRRGHGRPRHHHHRLRRPGPGTVGCVFIGMAEVSSCMVDVTPGQHVRKGEELGFFQYGGSTYCLFFEPGVVDAFVVRPPFSHDTPPVRVNGALARAR